MIAPLVLADSVVDGTHRAVRHPLVERNHVMSANTTTAAARGPLRVLEERMRLLVERERPLTLVVADLAAGLPEHPLNLVDLRSLLLHPSVGHQARGAIWVRLLELSGQDGTRGEEWSTACCAMALSGLWRTAARLRREAPALDQDDIQQCVLAGFWEALADLRGRLESIAEPGRIPASLCWSADRAARRHRLHVEGHAARRAELADLPDTASTSDGDRAPWLDLDVHLLLEQAVACGAIDQGLVDLITSTRLGTARIRGLAAAEGVGPEIVGMRRVRAERRIAKAFREGRITGR